MDHKLLRATKLRQISWLQLISVTLLAQYICIVDGGSSGRPHPGDDRGHLDDSHGRHDFPHHIPRSESQEGAGVTASNGDRVGQCDYHTTRTTYTGCVECAISHPGMCPTGSQATTTGQGLRDCTYPLPGLGDVSGCRHECQELISVIECCDGYWGQQCQECPGGASHPCSGNGQCSDGITGDGSCNCLENFGGETCDRCLRDNHYGQECASECDCVYGICDAGIQGQGHCLCLAGYFGERCTEMSEECKQVNCADHSHCHQVTDNGMRFVCRCDDGYLANEETATCMEINPCTLNSTMCHAEATCTHTGPNQHSCTCNAGYRGDGHLMCTPINLCNTDFGGCPTNSTSCVFDGPGQSHCECKWGYENFRENVGCAYVDICPRRTDCHEHADCVMVGPYEIQCNCKDGYMGDGYTCYGNIIQQLLTLNADSTGPLYGQLRNAITSFQQVHGAMLMNTGPFTVFVPNDNAFSRADRDVIASAREDPEFARYLYGLHIIPARLDTDQLNATDLIYTLTGMPAVATYSDRDPTLMRYRVKGASNKAKMVNVNLPALNGLIHVIDKIMYTEPRVESDDRKSISELIAHEGLFNRLQGMMEEADLTSLTHDSEGPFTVFAPKNNAFDTLLPGTLDYFTTREGRVKLIQLLQNHIITGSMISAADLMMQLRFTSSERTTMTASTNPEGLIQIEDPVNSSNSINITQSDILARNGYIHYIDGLLIPPSIMPLVSHRCDITQTGSPSIPQCCSGFYGESCLPCPGGFVTPCNNNGQCMDGISNNGTCVCIPGFIGTACELCEEKHFGENCTQVCTCLNGVCNDGPSGDGKCNPRSCSHGYVGENCEEFVHPCGPDLDQCHAHAQCEITDTIRCVCNVGYEGDGYACVPIDPCTKPNRGGCHVEAECVYTGPGTSRCECIDGWFGDGIVCLPVDNCQLSTYGGCDANAQCTYTGPGQSECNCYDGYMGDGIRCTAINSCLNNYGGCHRHASCVSTGAGINMCTCNAGFVGNGYVCFSSIGVEVAESPSLTQLLQLCQVSGMDRRLTDQSFNVTLFAPINEAFDDMSADDQNTWFSENNAATCVSYHILNGAWSYEDLVDRGEGPMATILSDADVMITVNYGELLIDGARIVTANLPATNGIIHLIDKVLIPPFTPHLSLPTVWDILTAREDYSRFLEAILDYGLDVTLAGLREYTIFVPNNDAFSALSEEEKFQLMPTVIMYHIIPDEKFYSVDLQDGFHHSTLLGHNFQLTFSNRQNEIMINGQAFIVEPDLQTDKGVIHGISKVLDVTSNRCDLNHTSSVPSSCTVCSSPPTCPDGYTPIIPPEGLQINCRYTRQIRGRTYWNDGCQVQCLKTQYTPNCCSGFYGQSCLACPGGAVLPCSGNGFCNDGIGGNGTCSCQPNFTGTACETCVQGFYGDKCDQACPCVHGICFSSSSDSVMCLCYDGWAGPVCDQAVLLPEIDNCPMPCDSNALCVLVGTQPECVCRNGFHGDGQTCIVQDLCGDNNGGCSEFASCMNVAGSRICQCLDGYSGDGVYCQEIDLCSDNNGGCHENAECVITGINMRACRCLAGYQGDGLVLCQEQNACEIENGGCSIFASCIPSGPNQRDCTCWDRYFGDGFTCVGNILEEMGRYQDYTAFNSLLHSVMDDVRVFMNSATFTVFVPNNEAFRRLEDENPGQLNRWREDGQIQAILEYHIVGCVTATLSDMQTLNSLTSLNGNTIYITNIQDSLILNGKAIVSNELLTFNGVIHEISEILVPETLTSPKEDTNYPPDRDDHRPPNSQEDHGPPNSEEDHRPPPGLSDDDDDDDDPFHLGEPMVAPTLQDLAQMLGYNRFGQLLTEAGLTRLVLDPLHTPFTIFMPTDEAFSFLPDGKLSELRDGQGTLTEYLKYHMIRDRKLTPQDLMVAGDLTTMQGSDISVGCWGNQGDIYVNEGDSRVVQRSMYYRGGIVHGIDRVLEPPSIGGRCDIVTNRTVMTACRSCSFPPICPPGSRPVGPVLQNCRYVVAWYNPRNGCRQQCTMHEIEPRCCDNHYGADCRECPRGTRNPCSGHGTCFDGHNNNGSCLCLPGFSGSACEMCQPGYYGRQCQACQCSENGLCVDGMTGDGSCFCNHGWAGTYCEVPVFPPPVCSPECNENAVCRMGDICECKPYYYGDGRNCTVVDRCQYDNGGCSSHADCHQTGTTVLCSCHDDYEGDGVVCRGVDLCETDNGGCHANATCRYSGPSTRTCSCNPPYEGDGKDCELRPSSPCNRLPSYCSENAYCVDVSPTSSFPYGDMRCVCREGYIGNGTMCNGDMYETLASISVFSDFFKSVMQMESKEGSEMIHTFKDITSKLTVFVPIDGCIPPNMTLNSKGVKSHILYGTRPLRQVDVRDGAEYITMSGISIHVRYDSGKDLWYINDAVVIEFDLPTMNGFIHVINSTLTQPVAQGVASEFKDEHKSMKSRIVAIAVVCIVVLALIVFLVYILYRRNRRKFDINSGPIVCSRYSSNGAEGGSVTFGEKTAPDEKPVFDNPMYAEATTSMGDNTS